MAPFPFKGRPTPVSFGVVIPSKIFVMVCFDVDARSVGRDTWIGPLFGRYLEHFPSRVGIVGSAVHTIGPRTEIGIPIRTVDGTFFPIDLVRVPDVVAKVQFALGVGGIAMRFLELFLCESVSRIGMMFLDLFMRSW